MASEPQQYPKWLYHRRHAPKGRIFQTAKEADGLVATGWVDTPAKFPKRSELTIAELREDFDDAFEQYRSWTTDGASEPGSERWEKATAAYNAARDSYQLALREAELATAPGKPKHRTGQGPQTFESAFATFTAEGVLAEGGTGKIFKVKDEDGAAWALKCLKPSVLSRQRLKRFKNEIAFSWKIKHPNIISVEDWGTTEISGTRVPFFVMPHFPSTLRQLMRAGLTRGSVLQWFEQMLSGMEAAHAVGVWHRDLKPENVLCDPSSNRLVITDFGIAHFAEPLLHTAVETSPSDRLANFQYAAPEQRAFGVVDHRADIYALGVILNEMFTGEILQGTGHRTIGSLAPDFACLDALVDRMVRQSPSDRMASIAEIRTLLPVHNDHGAASDSALLSGQPVQGLSEGALQTQANPGVFDRLRLYIFESADSSFPDPVHLDEHRIARDFQLAVGYVREFVEQLHREGFISASKWEGNRERPLDEWPTAKSFFQYNEDGGSLRVTMRQRGKQELDRLQTLVLISRG